MVVVQVQDAKMSRDQSMSWISGPIWIIMDSKVYILMTLIMMSMVVFVCISTTRYSDILILINLSIN